MYDQVDFASESSIARGGWIEDDNFLLKNWPMEESDDLLLFDEVDFVEEEQEATSSCDIEGGRELDSLTFDRLYLSGIGLTDIPES